MSSLFHLLAEDCFEIVTNTILLENILLHESRVIPNYNGNQSIDQLIYQGKEKGVGGRKEGKKK